MHVGRVLGTTTLDSAAAAPSRVAPNSFYTGESLREGEGSTAALPVRVRDGVLDVVVIFMTLALGVWCTGT